MGNPQPLAQPRIPTCPYCGNRLNRVTVKTGRGSDSSRDIGLVIGLLLTLTCVGAVVGIPLMLSILVNRGTPTTQMVCPSCGPMNPAHA